MGTLRGLIWITQLGFSVAAPMVMCILAAAWLRDKLGGWVMIPGIILGLGGAISSGLSFCRRAKGREPGEGQPPAGFNEHH